MKEQTKLRIFKRVLIYLLGLFIMALGVSISKLSNLGVSPVNSIPAVVSEIFEIDMGICTMIIFIGFILIQILILQKHFKKTQCLQIFGAVIFGAFVSLTNLYVTLFVPAGSSYFLQILYIFISVILVAFGILLYLEANILSLPGEGVMQALTYKTGISLASAKMIFDWTVVGISVLLSILSIRTLVGVREGTVIAAFGVGICLKIITKYIKKPLQDFLK